MSTGRSDPSPSFRFKVEFRGGPGVSARFTECSGLTIEAPTYDYAEGGDSSRMHRLPGRVRHGDLELKRGIAPDGARLWDWVIAAARGQFDPCIVTVTLLGLDGSPVREWSFLDAYPVKWSATPFSAADNSIAIETLSIAHQGLLM